MQRLKRLLFSNNLSGGLQPDLMSGADGVLFLDGTSATISAGDLKRYDSIAIINNGTLYVAGASTYGLDVNDGSGVTVIGCKGSCTITSGGQIIATENGLRNTDTPAFGATIVRASLPFDCVYGSSIAYNVTCGLGGEGGDNAYAYGQGFDSDGWGHGGGGAGYGSGGMTYNDVGWGQSGYGADSGTNEFGGFSVGPYYNGFGVNGNVGGGGEVGTGISFGAGGSGGTRGISGGCVYIQIGGSAYIDNGSGPAINVSGSQGGYGGDGGPADTTDSVAVGGGGGGGGGGGTIIIRYKVGVVNLSSLYVYPGNGGGYGNGGNAGPAAPIQYPGSTGGNGMSGSGGLIDVATY